MKTKLLILALLLGMTGAASAKVSWEGEVFVIAVSGESCATTGERVGRFYKGVFTPQGISDNGNSTNLALIDDRAGFSMKFTSTVPNSSYAGTKIGSRGAGSTGTGKLVSLTFAPATVTATTKTFVLNAKIANFNLTIGCTATIRGNFVQRVNAPS